MFSEFLSCPQGGQKFKFAQNVMGSILRHVLPLMFCLATGHRKVSSTGGSQKFPPLESCGKSKNALEIICTVLPLTMWEIHLGLPV